VQVAHIISVGTELSLGQTVDTNAGWLAAQLAAEGVRCVRHVTVPDDRDAIAAELRAADTAADLILVTGGLGPTDDDLTREGLADALGVELVEDATSLDRIRAFFAQREREMSDRNARQARVPLGGRAIANPRGTAPGLFAELSGRPCYCMPGVPSEMRAMFERDVLPAVRAAARGRVIRSRKLLCFGLGESDLGEQIADLMQRGRNPEVGTTADLSTIGIRINATATSRDEADTLLAQAEVEIRARLGPLIFGQDEDTLAMTVGRLLVSAGATLATAESCTGGLVGKLLTDTPGSSAYYAGGAVTYSNESKESILGVPGALISANGAVSGPVAEAMAQGAQRRFDATLAVSVTGVAGPDGGTPDKPVGLVYIALADGLETRAHRYHFGRDASRTAIRRRAAWTALNLVRMAYV
jgi:nicotinamide-nucleotide amidase